MNQIVFSFTVFLAGILSFFSPCVFPLLPVYIGVLLGSDQEKSIQIFGKKIRWHGLVKTLCFIAGISVIFLIIAWSNYVYQLVPIPDGSADYYSWPSSDGSLSL